MRLIVFVIFCWVATVSQAQTTGLFVNDDVDRYLDSKSFSIHNQARHSVFRPYLPAASAADSMSTYLGKSWSTGSLHPLIDLGIEGRTRGDDIHWSSRALLGLGLHQRIAKRLDLQAALYGGVVDGQSPFGVAPVSDRVYAGVGEYAERNGRAGQLWDGRFALRYTPSDIFTLEVGRGEHFLGDGYRSLFLSDNAAAYPYFKIDTKVWHIDYMNLFSQQQGIFDQSAENPEYRTKYTASHMLSWNVSPRVNLQLFETIIWQGTDSLSQRGLDVYYLNPIIFYRPVEFAAGSADNAIIGAGLSYKIYPKTLFYFQLVVDEFLLDQVFARDGWWANKFGVLAGVKSYDTFGKEGLYMQFEFSAVRPFTYSHGSPIQSHTHLDQALAHPQGANFVEMLGMAVIPLGNGFEIREQLGYTVKGNDSNGQNLGGDIFRSYASPERILGNSIGQGSRSALIDNGLYLSKVLDEESDTRFMIGYQMQADLGDGDYLGHTISLGIRSNVGDIYR